MNKAKTISHLADALKAHQEKSHSAYLCHFDGKDADLEDTGSGGIKEIVTADNDFVTFVVAGHKTICPLDPGIAEDAEGIDEWKFGEMEEENEIISSAAQYMRAEWTGDEWESSFSETVTVQWVFNEDTSINYENTAQAMVDLANKLLDPIRENWKKIEQKMDALSEKIRA